MPVVKHDDHKEDIELLLKEIDIEKRGVVHIGAHKGQEVGLYLELGFKNIMLIEANPHWVEFLKQEFRDTPEVQVIHMAIANLTGEIDLHIHTSQSGSTEPASILQMKEFNRIVKTLNTAETIKVPASKL